MAAPIAPENHTNGHGHADTPSVPVQKPAQINSTIIASRAPVTLTPVQEASHRPTAFHSSEQYDASSILSRSQTSTRQASFRSTTTENYSHKFSADQQVTVLRQTVIASRGRLISDLDYVDDNYIDTLTVQSFLEYIQDQRLIHMPQRGSRWDKVLNWAEFFALQISGYEKVLSSFVPETKSAARLIWAGCRVLIELGPANSQAIETAFAVFYKLGLALSFFLRHHQLLYATSHIRQQVGNSFNDILVLVRDVSLAYCVRINSLSANVTLDFNSLFGHTLAAFYGRRDHIIDDMWKSKLGEHYGTHDIGVIRSWLSVGDSTTKTILRDHVASRAKRDEYTCGWFQRTLLDFSRSSDDVLSVTGVAGSGKSILSAWVTERLHRPLNRRSHEALTYVLDDEIPALCTPLAVVKSLALQLLEIQIGDVSLLKNLSSIYELSDSATSADVEIKLWGALGAGLNVKSDFMIIIDGLDHVRGGDHSADVISKHIGELASEHLHTKAIIFSRRTPQLSNTKAMRFNITADLVHNDIHHITKHALRSNQQFRSQNENDQEATVEHLTHASKGSFLWLLLTVNFLKREVSSDGFAKAIKSIKEKPATLAEQLQKLTNDVDFTKSETKSIISWLLVAERPLRLAEIKSLLQVDLQKKTHSLRKIDVESEIIKSSGSLLLVQNGIVRFRHADIRAHIAKLQDGKLLPSPKAAHDDLTLRLLTYLRVRLVDEHKLGFEGLHKGEIQSLFRKDALLEYAVQTWILHFQKSSMLKPTGPFEFSADFKALFPGSVQLVMLEWTSLNALRSEAGLLHDLALRIRKGVFGETHESVLQNLIVCGSVYRKTRHLHESSDYFYHASSIAQLILEKHSSIAITCTTTFLELTETMTFTTRTEVFTHKETMLKYIIGAFKIQYGKTSDIVIRYTKVLAELYVSINEIHEAELIWRDLHEIMVLRHGKSSKEATDVSGHLEIILKKGGNQGEIVQYDTDIFEVSTEVEVWDIHRIKIALKLALSYEHHHEILKAEEIYVMLWSQLIEQSHRSTHQHIGIDIHISVIDLALDYARFLRRLHRHEEAASILICLWTEYEEYDFDSETVFLRLKIVGELLVEIKLYSIALSIFNRCLSWFKFHKHLEHVESCETLVTTTELSITTISLSTTTTTTTTTTTETVMKEVFESTISKTVVTSETIKICSSLVSYYMKLENWSEAIKYSSKTLHMIWKIIISGGSTIALPKFWSHEAVSIALNLALCHHRSRHFHEAEEIYLRIYRACWNSCSFDDKRLVSSYTALLTFYESYEQWRKIHEIYEDLLTASRKHHGTMHSHTIELLYTLAVFSHQHGHGNPCAYYEDIILVLNKGNVCHKDAVDAMIYMCQFYFQEGDWKKLKPTVELLWETWVHHHHEYKFTPEFIETLYMQYIYVLEHHSHAGYEVIRSITIKYREICVKSFGILTRISIRALIELAQICLRSEKHVHEAISHYEEVIKTVTTVTETTTTTTTKTQTIISTESILSIRQKLTKAYIDICSHGSVTSTVIEKAINVLTERFIHLKITFGYQTETLVILQELITLHRKIKTKESHATIVRYLFEATISIISREKHSKTLHESAKIVSGLYLSCGLVEEGRQLINELRRHIVFKLPISEKAGFKLDHAVGRECYVFIATFEETLQESHTLGYSEIMAILLTETVLYESYAKIKNHSDIELVLFSGARLYTYLVKYGRTELSLALQEELLKLFLKKYGANIKSTPVSISLFFVALLYQLGTSIKKVHIGNAACISTNQVVEKYISASKYKEAYEIASCALQFIHNQNAYHHLQNIPYGFKLSVFMATKINDLELHAKMLDLSKLIIREVLQGCKDAKINFVQLKLTDLNELVGLLGEQKNYAELEWLLNSLWSSREVQKSWTATPATVISIGILLVQTRFLLGPTYHSKAIRLCEAICYNLRQVSGGLSKRSLKLQDLLSKVYMTAGRYKDAMGVHEDVLRLVVDGDEADESLDGESGVDAAVVREHIEGLKRSWLRNGGWDKKPAVYEELVKSVLELEEYKGKKEFDGLKGVSEWNLKDKDDGSGRFQGKEKWVLDLQVPGKGRGDRGLKRVTSNWGMSDVYDGLLDHEEYEEEFIDARHEYGNGNGNGNGNGTGLIGKMLGGITGNGNGHANGNGKKSWTLM